MSALLAPLDRIRIALPPLLPLICHLSLSLSSDIPSYPVSLLLRLLLFVLRSGFDKFVMRRCLRCHIIMLTCQKRQPIILLWLTPSPFFLPLLPSLFPPHLPPALPTLCPVRSVPELALSIVCGQLCLAGH